MRNWIWQQISIDLPEEWELLQFSRSPQAGRCAFADRYQYRFELDWRRVQGQPDFERMLSDYRARLQEMGMEGAKPVQRAGWQGVTGRENKRATARFGQHFPSLGCLVEVVFLWPKAAHVETETAVLRTLHPEPATALGQARWKAFGMNLLTGAGYVFDHCAAEPANDHMLFMGEHKRVRDRFTRKGMLKEWLRVSVQQWTELSVPKGYRIRESRVLAAQEHDLVRVSAVRRRPVLRDLLFGRREFQAATWICPHDGRLYSVSREAPRPRSRRSSRPPPALSCCSQTEVTL